MLNTEPMAKPTPSDTSDITFPTAQNAVNLIRVKGTPTMKNTMVLKSRFRETWIGSLDTVSAA